MNAGGASAVCEGGEKDVVVWLSAFTSAKA